MSIVQKKKKGGGERNLIRHSRVALTAQVFSPAPNQQVTLGNTFASPISPLTKKQGKE